MTHVLPDVRDKVVEAFLAVRDGASPDYLIVDPERNRQFIAHCRRLALSQSTYHLNRHLFQIRNDERLTGTPTRSEDSSAHEDEYRFAVEMASRFLERKHDTTLDRMICDPAVAAEFDRLAQRIAPGFSPVQYRIAALNVWKDQRLQSAQGVPEIYPEDVQVTLFSAIPANHIPQGQGLYVLHQGSQTRYVGETKNLRVRLVKHREHAEREGSEHWVWEREVENLILEYRVFPQNTSTSDRRALAFELIRSRRPVFNIL